MKEKAVTAALGIVLIVSVAINVYLLWLLSETKGQVTVFSDQVIITDEKIAELTNQLSEYEDWKKEAESLQQRLEDYEGQISSLADSLSESNLQIESLKSMIAENEATIAELEVQIAENQRQQQSTTGNSGNSNNNTPVNTMPAGLGGFTFGDIPAGTGTGAGSAYGQVGTFE